MLVRKKKKSKAIRKREIAVKVNYYSN